MPAAIPDSIETQVRVVSVLSARTARVRLLNGREVLGYAGKTASGQPLAAGAAYHALLFVADFSRAELLGPVEADQSAKSI